MTLLQNENGDRMAPKRKKDNSLQYEHVRYDMNGNIIDDEGAETLESYSDAITGAIGSAVYNSAVFVSDKVYNVYEWTSSKIRAKNEEQGLPM